MRCSSRTVAIICGCVAQLQPHSHHSYNNSSDWHWQAVSYWSCEVITELPRGSCTSGTLSAHFTMELWDSLSCSLLQLLMSLIHIFPLRQRNYPYSTSHNGHTMKQGDQWWSTARSTLKYSLVVFPAVVLPVTYWKSFSCSVTSFNWDRTDGDLTHASSILKATHVNLCTSVDMESEMCLENGPRTSKLQVLLKWIGGTSHAYLHVQL